MSHTPGPWHVSKGQFTVARADGRILCRTNIEHNDENRENARLIAAAPELLEALVSLLTYETRDNLDRYTGPQVDGILSAARAAISKATGGKS